VLAHPHHPWPCPAPAPIHCDLSLFHHPSHRSSSTTTITLTGLPPKTIKADVRSESIFQCFGEVTRVFVQQDGRRADVVFADVHSVKCTLHAYAEKPRRLRSREIIVFRKYTKMNRGMGRMEINDKQSGTDIQRRRPHGLGRVVMTERYLCPTFPPR